MLCAAAARNLWCGYGSEIFQTYLLLPYARSSALVFHRNLSCIMSRLAKEKNDNRVSF